MWSQNAFTDRLNLKWPILQAPMGWLSTPALAAAVSNAGGLGGLGMWGFSAEEAERRIAGFQQLSGGSERAALGWTEALTRLSEGHRHASAYEALKAQFTEAEQVKLTLTINIINGWNRIAVGFGLYADAAAIKSAAKSAAA